MNASFKFFIFLNINFHLWLMAEVQIDGELFDHPVEELKPEDAFINDPALRKHSKKNMSALLKTKARYRTRSTKPPYRTLFADECTNYAYACMRAYDTGPVCGRAMYYTYKTFKNFCMMDYTNCVQKYIMWETYHMGKCYKFVYAPNYDVWLPIHATAKKTQDKLPTTNDYRRAIDTRPTGRYHHHNSKKTSRAVTLYTSRRWRPGKTIHRHIFKEECDYLAYYCLKAFDTGLVCARTLYFKYQTFKNFCMLDFANCMERYEIWFPVYNGKCEQVNKAENMEHYHYQDDFFLDQIFAIEK